MQTQKGYILTYKTGGPQSFFWSQEEMNNHVDSRNRVVSRTYEIDAENVYVKPDSKKRQLYYVYQSKPHKIMAIVESKAHAQRYTKQETGKGLGNGWYISGLDTPNWRS